VRLFYLHIDPVICLHNINVGFALRYFHTMLYSIARTDAQPLHAAMQKTNVNQMKASMDFRDGIISGIGKYDPGVSEDATMIQQVKFFLSAYIREHLLSGNASIEIRAGRLCVDHDIRPAKFAVLLDRKLQKRYRVFNENQ
jgi:hypothetical protein